LHMEIKRTANAGVLLRLDGVSVLLDGVCNEVKPYLKTPDSVRDALLASPPDVVAFTHQHADHYDAAFVSDYLKNTAGPALGPADIPLCNSTQYAVGGVHILSVPTRHLGRTDPVAHFSYVICGSVCVWFMGDAAPTEFSARGDLPKPDVMIAPYAYATAGGWEITKRLAPKVLIVVHMPGRQNDPYGLWEQVEATVGSESGIGVYIPTVGQRIRFAK